MKPERLQTIDRLFESALDLDPKSRPRFLDQACAGDADLRHEVESLLQAHEQAGDFIVDSASDVAAAILEKNAPRPTQVAQYQIERLLGAGGMGEVYLATDSRLKRKVALKLLPAWLVSNSEHRQRFEREAQAASALNHPNICTIYEINEHDGTSFIAMEYVDGETLLARIVGTASTKPAPQSLHQILEIALQAADALAEAHEHGIVHRDIKPANIIVNRRGQVKILDFGLAKRVAIESEAETQQYLSQAGMVMGTAAYMSPEQARGLPVDARTDVWSFGVMLYEMLAGEKPFAGATTADLLAAILRSEPEPLHELNGEIPADLESIVLKMLRKDRGERYSTAKELLSDLKEIKGNLDFTTAQKRADGRSHPVISKPESQNSIAVLPFVNLSAEPENEYFCDGLAEELLNALAKIDGLKVAARTSSFSFKGKDAQVSEIGTTLGVKTVLEGSVRKSGNRMRITLQLINAADGYHIWSERYDRDLQDIFDVQDEITLAVVEALKVRLFGDEKVVVLKRHTQNVEAYQLYLKGRYYWWKTTPEDFHKSRDFFQRAVDTDPTYALGYCGLSSYYGFGSAWGMVPPDQGWPRAIAANTKAMELDNTLAEAHSDLAGISMVCYRDSAATQREAQRAVELNPKFLEIHYLYSFFLLTKGRFDEAIAEGRQAMELDPLSLRVNQHLGHSYFLARRYDEAISQYQLALELDANNASVHESLGDALEQKGMYEAAVAEWQLAMELPGNREGAALLGRSFARDGFEKAMRTVAQMKLEHLKAQRAQGDYIPAIRFARIYTGLGDTEAAFEWLEKACEERNVFPLLIHADPFYDRLRADPRFAALLQRFNLTDHEKVHAAGELQTSAPSSDSPSSEGLQRETKTQNEQTRQDKPKMRRYFLGTGVLGLLLLVVAGLVYWFYGNRHPPIESIAVMPFRNESGNSDVEYLSDGMTDSLITSLSQLPQLSVKARSSVFRYKNKDASPQQVGKELNVQAVLNGRVIQRGNDLTLHIELVDVKTETALWSGDYNRSMTNLATLQGEIARDVSQKLQARLSGADQQKVARNYTDNAEAYQLYLKGRYHHYRLTKPELDKAIEFYQQAIALDQSYALAYAGLSAAYRSLALTSDVPSNETLPKAKAAALRALEIDDTLADAHANLGVVAFWYDWDWKAAEKHFLRALELNPDSTAHMGYAQLLSSMGQHEKALAEAKRSIDLEPLNLRNNAVEGQVLFFAGKYDEAIDRLQKTIELDPKFWLSHLFLARVYIEKKMYTEAVAEATEASEASGGNSEAVAHVVYALAKAGKHEEARRTLDGLKKRAAERDVPPYAFALSYNGLGETDEAIAWLVKGLEQRDVKMALLTVDPKWNNLRSDPRFQDLLRRAGFAQ